jgi:hypothetical protein
LQDTPNSPIARLFFVFIFSKRFFYVETVPVFHAPCRCDSQYLVVVLKSRYNPLRFLPSNHHTLSGLPNPANKKKGAVTP